MKISAGETPALSSQQWQQCMENSFLPSLLFDSLCRAESQIILVYSGALPVFSPTLWVRRRGGCCSLGSGEDEECYEHPSSLKAASHHQCDPNSSTLHASSFSAPLWVLQRWRVCRGAFEPHQLCLCTFNF